jgi:hypothetical protein
MAYVVPADFRERTRKPWAAGLILSEGDASDADLTTVIGLATSRVEAELDDDFEPPSPDNDETIYVDGTIGSRLYIPRRVRSLTTVSTRSLSGTITAITSTSYRLRSSLNAAGTAMVGKRDWLDSGGGRTWYSEGGIQLIGKFGWAVVPDDIKRLVALIVYDTVKATSDPITRLTQKSTVDAVFTYGESREMARISTIYSRGMPVVA